MTDFVERLKSALADRYTIEREIGSGGMASVYLAHDVKHDRKVAVKVLRPELAAVLGAERFLKEIKVTANLQHPHILQLYDSGEADGFLYYVMPYVEGRSLRDKLAREGELPIEDAVRILRDVVDALTEARAHGVVHRDIKPENIMLRGRHALVTDFGVAKAVSEASGRDELTTAGVSLGTPTYMAPEQAAADPHLDHRADVYAVGVVAYELLTGRPPFMGTTPQMILSAHVTEAPRPVTAHRDTVPAALEALVMRCLEKKPADRWQSADELLTQLEALATPSGGVTPTATRPVRGVRDRRLSVAPVVGGLIVVALVVLWWWVLVRDGGPTSPGFADAVRIAVLPFENLSASDVDEYFSDGMTRDVNTQLAKLSGFIVIAHGSAVRASATGGSYADMASALGVEYLVAGSVRRGDGLVRVNASLIDPETAAQLWADALDSEDLPDALVQMEAAIAEHVASALNVPVAPEERRGLAAQPTTNPEAYDAYQLGRFYEAKRGRWNLRTAAQHFERAIAADSGYAHAWSGLADTYTLLLPATYGEEDVPAAELLDAAERAARRAIALDSTFAEGHASLGFALAEAWRWDEAAEAYQRAIALEPRLANAHHWYAYLLVSIGRMDDAVREIELARQLDPISMIISNSGAGILAAAGHSREATATYERTAALHPDALFVMRDAAMHYLRMGEFERAAHYIEAWSKTWPQPNPERGRQWANRFREPATRAGALREMAVTDAFPLGPDLYMLSGDRDSALAVLERWSRERLEPGRLSPNMLQMYVLNEELQREPLYRDMLERMGVGGGR